MNVIHVFVDFFSLGIVLFRSSGLHRLLQEFKTADRHLFFLVFSWTERHRMLPCLTPNPTSECLRSGTLHVTPSHHDKEKKTRCSRIGSTLAGQIESGRAGDGDRTRSTRIKKHPDPTRPDPTRPTSSRPLRDRKNPGPSRGMGSRPAKNPD